MPSDQEPTPTTPPTPPVPEESTTPTEGTTEGEPTPTPNPTPTEGGEETPKEGEGSGGDKSLLGGGDENPFGLDPVDLEAAKAFVPEGMEVTEALEPFLELINGATSRADIVKGVLETYGEMQAKNVEANAEAWNTFQNSWRDEVSADPKLGGENLEKSLSTAAEVIATYAPDAAAFKEVLNVTGAGNSIHMVRFLNAVAEAIPGEASPVTGTTQPVEKSRAEKLFG